MTSRVRRLVMMKFVVQMIGAFFRTVCFVVEPNYGKARMR